VLREHRDVATLRRPALGLFLLLIAQVSLGAITIWSGREVIPTTSHVAIGAAVLATSLALTLKTWRMFGLRHAIAVDDRAGARIASYQVTA
jgi:heme A synthase